MKFSFKYKYIVVFLLFIASLTAGALYISQKVNIPIRLYQTATDNLLNSLHVLPGYNITFFVPPSVAKLRQLAIGEDGWVFAGSTADKVYAFRDQNNDGEADDMRIVAQGINSPHGVAFYQNALYIGTVPAIYKIDNVIDILNANGEFPQPALLIDNLINNNWHGTRHIKFGPDGMLYVSLGTPCNVCLPDTELSGVIRRYMADGRGGEVYARGIRNSVGFDWHPRSGALWFTDNGRDWLGDDLPSDELNHAPQAGMHFGFPYCHQENFSDPKYGAQRPCSDFSPPALLTGAHVANLGMTFDASGHYAYIALHGSWNRSKKSGYAVRRTRIEDGQAGVLEPFVEGWLRQESVSGRPVDIAFTATGDMLISDDYAGAIYRVRKTD